MNSESFPTIPDAPPLKCPTCGLKFHAERQCRRCKTDLTFVMETVEIAWKLRNQARHWLMQGEYEQALSLARRAQTMHRVPMGDLLVRFSEYAVEQRIRYIFKKGCAW